MAIRKIVSRSITDGVISTSDLAAGSLSSAGLDITGAGGTGSALLPKGTTAERPGSPVVGYIRYNTTTDCYEQYTSIGWAGIAAPPTISSISPTTYSGETGTTITINGANFDAGTLVTFITNGGTAYSAGATTFVSGTQLTATTPQDFSVADEPLDIKVTKTNGLSITFADALDCGGSPSWSTASGSIGTYYDSQRTISTSVSASDPDVGGSIASYAVTSGSLPTGLSLNSTTGAITGTANAVGSDTTYSFTIRATDNAGNTSDRSFSIAIKAPIITTYTTVGSGTYSVPSGITSVRVMLVAGGGGGGGRAGGGGGGGGMIEHPSFPVTPGGSVSYTLGGGASGAPGTAGYGGNGSNSVFGTLTAIGGGGGGDAGDMPSNPNGVGGGQPGGSGGGGGYDGNRGTGTQPSQPGNSGTYGYGYPGGYGTGNPNNPGTSTGEYNSGGGGGAGGVGGTSSNTLRGVGGPGRASTISGSSVYYAGGGGGGDHVPSTPAGGTGGQGGGGNAGATGFDGPGSPGTTNTGGGGGGGSSDGGTGGSGGNGGPGIIIVAY